MRILLITSHLSTGGMPQVALKRVETLIKKHDVYLIEYREIAWTYVVQKNKIKDLLGDKFISLGWIDREDIRDHFQEIVEKINPDIIHMEEIPEKFIFGMRTEHSDWLYRKDRPYKIIETTHTSTFNINQKVYFPDKFLFVSKYSQNEYSRFNIPSSVIEYPVEKLEKNKGLAIKELKFNPEYFHVLNIGLFTRDKNQGYLFDIAKKLEDYKIHFHFVGNQAENFTDYWKPLMEKKLDNCFVYGERNDVELFYQASDLLVHPSILELNPLAIKEATSYDLPVYLCKLSTYLDMYDNYKNIKYLTMNIDNDAQMILDNFNIKRKDDEISFSKSLIAEYDNVLNLEVSNFETPKIFDYNITFVDGARVEILGNSILDFGVEIFEKNTKNLLYSTKLLTNCWCVTNSKCYKEYKVDIRHKGELILSHDFDLANKNVMIQLDSKSIGDTLAWFPYVEEFRKKHNCKVYCSTFWNKWFVNQYPDIIFLEPGQSPENLYAKYLIGWYLPVDLNRNPIDYKKIPLQKTASDILGLDYKEIIPKIEIPEGVRPIQEKYVCIAQFSTANSKHWHYPCKDSNKGWQIIVDWLNAQGYKVMVISKQPTSLKNVIDKTGDFPIEHRINELKWCEFFIGIGSGLSWLAWAVGKKVVMISGFSNPICEFKTNIINVHNFNVCNGCFNKYEFDRGDWNWCPEHKDTNRQFECSINITPQMIIDRIVNSKLVEKVQEFDFKKYGNNITLDRNDININYNKDLNRITFNYKNDQETPQLNIDIKDFNTNKSFHIISDIILSKKYNVWCVPEIELYKETNKLLISFYEKNKILDIEFYV
jgi:autotransporter strand-loop-strand O-heptosyltransferase